MTWNYDIYKKKRSFNVVYSQITLLIIWITFFNKFIFIELIECLNFLTDLYSP